MGAPAFDGGAAASLASVPAFGAELIGETMEIEIPQITMDVESLERSYRATLSQRTVPNEQVQQPPSAVSLPMPVIPDFSDQLEAKAQGAPLNGLPAITRMPITPGFASDDATLTFAGPAEPVAIDASNSPAGGENPFLGLFDGATAPRSSRSSGSGSSFALAGIELGPPPSEPLVLEDVVVTSPTRSQSQSRARSSFGGKAPPGEAMDFPNPFDGTREDVARGPRSAFSTLGIGDVRAGHVNGSSSASASVNADTNASISRAEIEATIDDVLMRALERAVPAKIESKFDLEWNRMAQDVAARIKSDVAASLRTDLTAALRGLIEEQARREMQSWLGREIVGLAKDVVREEIRRLIEE
jgi:hypothetical protein